MAKCLGKIPGTYCPVCGNMGLMGVMKEGELWAYCPLGGDGPEVNHTAFKYVGSSRPLGYKDPPRVKRLEPVVEEENIPEESD